MVRRNIAPGRFQSVRVAIRSDQRRTGTSTQLFSVMADLTTIQFTDFGRGSAMGILYLIMVSIVITFFFKQMRKRID